ncbi:MAG: TIGR04282 family arsenosugar biosynthesis glycosyltransferase [Afipia sp.]
MGDIAERQVQLAIFAKAPVAGYAKTRLIPELGAEGAASLHAFFIRRAVETALTSSLRPVSLWCAPDSSHDMFRWLHRVYGIEIFGQVGENLGERMLDAFVRLIERGPVVLIGTDCPVLSAVHLDRCAAALRDTDAVFTPAEDGGYVLIGLRQPEPRLFEEVAFGTEVVMRQTRERVKELRLKAIETETLWDVDTAADFKRARSVGLIPKLFV